MYTGCKNSPLHILNYYDFLIYDISLQNLFYLKAAWLKPYYNYICLLLLKMLPIQVHIQLVLLMKNISRKLKLYDNWKERVSKFTNHILLR